jgi:hypothetical protein
MEGGLSGVIGVVACMVVTIGGTLPEIGIVPNRLLQMVENIVWVPKLTLNLAQVFHRVQVCHYIFLISLRYSRLLSATLGYSRLL